MPPVAKVAVDLEANSAKFTSGLSTADAALARSARKWDTSAKGMESKFVASMRRSGQAVAAIDGPLGGIASRFQSLGALANTSGVALGAMAVGIGLVTFAMGKAVAIGQQLEQAQLKTEAVLKATGSASGQTAASIRAMSKEIALATLASTAGVETAAQKLMTFRSVGSDVFQRTLEAAQDLSAVGFGSLESTVVQLGKALENPAEGISALTRVGVSFTASQKAMIKALQDSGRVLEAQGVILAAVENQVGGAGKAEGEGLTGAIDTLGERWDDLLKTIADRTGIVATAAKDIKFLADAIKGLTDGMGVDARIAAIDTAIEQMDSLQSRIANAPTDTLWGTLGFMGGGAMTTDGQIEALRKRRKELGSEKATLEAIAEIKRQEAELKGKRAQEQIGRDAKGESDKKSAEEAAKEAEKRAAMIAKQVEALQFEEAQLTRTNREKAVYNALKAAGLSEGDAEAAQVRALAESLYDASEAQTALNEALEREQAARDGLDKYLSDMKQETNLLRAQGAEREKLRALLEAEAIAKEGGIDLSKQQQEAIAREVGLQYELAEAEREVAEAARDAERMARDFGSVIGTAFEDAVLNGEKLGDVLKALERDIARVILRQAVTKPLENAVGGLLGGIVGSFSFGSLFGGGKSSAPTGSFRAAQDIGIAGARADGGPVMGGSTYLVGERGPELFTPNATGSIIPNHELRGGGGGSSGPTVFIDARGADQAGFARLERMIHQLRGEVRPMAVSAVADAARRGGSASLAIRGGN